MTGKELVAKKDLEYAQRQQDAYYLDETNSAAPVVRWKSNNNVPFNDMLQHFVNFGWITDQIRLDSNAQRDRDTDAFLADCRKQMENHVPSGEEMYEMRSAFGTGTTVVNIFTGKRTRL